MRTGHYSAFVRRLAEAPGPQPAASSSAAEDAQSPKPAASSTGTQPRTVGNMPGDAAEDKSLSPTESPGGRDSSEVDANAQQLAATAEKIEAPCIAESHDAGSGAERAVWYHASDSYVKRASEQQVQGCEAYILLYQRKSKPPMRGHGTED